MIPVRGLPEVREGNDLAELIERLADATFSIPETLDLLTPMLTSRPPLI